MQTLFGALVAVALQQGFTTPPGGDTTGYWQQRVAYTIVAHLDEPAQRVRARGVMRYVNNSPDTLRELYVHQYLNAFRPASAWSEADAREGRVRFQVLRDPDHGYERFTAPVRVNDRDAEVTYPGAPDSTVARIGLPSALVPGDSVTVAFAWDARPSTLPRRQGRRGRHWDLAQWYPRIAVYDRGGWQFNALQPAGEFYGEFGTYDVTLVVRDDQVLAATGVPVSGDPGWARALRAGEVYTAAGAYGNVPAAPPVDVPAGHKAVRFYARDVHHFAWSASPDYRYEGGVYARTPPRGRMPAWDRVALHVLYQPGDDSTWGRGLVLQRSANAVAWLERIFGRYAYPQMTVLHRIEGGGTEFPMLQMNGSPSQGLILHEGGHVWAHGILANNEWRSGWLDEGLTSYQTEWAQGLTPQERVRAGVVDRFVEPAGYRRRAISIRIPRFDAIGLQQALTDLQGDAEPIGTVAHEFRDFATYNTMIYTRAQVMYGQLRDALGDSAWHAFLRDYYDRWALRHVDERAMRGSAARAAGSSFGWFFDQWVHRTGVTDYALGAVRQSRSGAHWITEAEVIRRGDYAHPMTVGVRTASGWTTVRIADPARDVQTARIETAAEPLEVRLDPHHFSWDWDRRNDARGVRPRVAFDWPFLRQADRERSVLAFRPLAWYSGPGGANAAVRARSSYLGEIDRRELGVAFAFRDERPVSSALQYWIRVENPYLRVRSRPLMGWSAAAARLDDLVFLEGAHRMELRGPRRRGWYAGRLTFSDALAEHLVPEQWAPVPTVAYTLDVHERRDGTATRFTDLAATVGGTSAGAFAKAELAVGATRSWSGGIEGRLRLFGSLATGVVPPQHATSLAARDAVSTFRHNWWRPRGAILKQDRVNGLPLGGAGLRAYHWAYISRHSAAANVDLSRDILEAQSPRALLRWRVHAFADVAYAAPLGAWEVLSDAGAGLGVRGRLYDRDVTLRMDLPLYLSHPRLARDAGVTTRGRFSWRYVLSFTDIWPD